MNNTAVDPIARNDLLSKGAKYGQFCRSAANLSSDCVISSAIDSGDGKPAPLIIQEQGSFAVGGTVFTEPGTFDPTKISPEGQTFHGDHAYVFYQIPVNAHKLPLVFWHGMGQFSKTWETTPDGRDGYQNIFLRRGFGVYVIDQPRRGNAGRSTQPSALTPVPDEQRWFNFLRVGIWPNYFPGVQFSRDSEALNQYLRQMTPDTGPIDLDVDSSAITALFNKIGLQFLLPIRIAAGWAGAPRSRAEMSAPLLLMNRAAISSSHLPEIGIRGNTHFPFSDLNNLEIADLMYEFLEKKGLN